MKKTKGLSVWQLTMMALGTVIGGSFFLGSGVAIHAAGPAIILSYILGGGLVYLILLALSEMTVANPACGSFRAFAAQAYGPGMGFVVGWVYWTGMVLAMSSEATAVSILVRDWAPGISVPLLGGAIIFGVTLLNLLGADHLSKLESGLAAIKLLAILSFILLAGLFIVGALPGAAPLGWGALAKEPFAPGGIKGMAGSMLIVMFAYAGFEVIGLAASEAGEPHKTIPKAITNTVLCLVGFYIISVALLLPLIPTASLNGDISPMVAALTRQGIGRVATVLNMVMITAILSTMLAAMFGLGRMMRSLAEEGFAPPWLRDTREVPYRGILFSGLAMLGGLAAGLLLPQVYLFLVSSGGFALLFTYTVIMATHLRFRKDQGCPPAGKCQMPGYPYTSWFVLASLALIMVSMPFIAGQGSGLAAGLVMTGFYILLYCLLNRLLGWRKRSASGTGYRAESRWSAEFSRELCDPKNRRRKNGTGRR